ncbi:MAG: glycosyltransferase family 2 protein, partial [Actinomycetes bacterium]
MTVPVGGLRLSYVVPAWNEADGITTTLDALANSASQLAADGVIATAEFVVVDDGSTDGTPELLAQRSVADARLTVVTHDRNRGLGAAIRSGLAAATGDVVVYTDADLPFDLAEVRTGLDTMQRTDADIVSLYRYSRSGEGARRYVFSLVYNALVRWGLGLRVRDVNFAGKLLRRAVLDAVDLHSEGSFIDAELLARAQRAGFRITQFGVNYFPRSRGVSTLSSTPVVLNILREFLRLRPAIRAAGPSLSGSAHTDGVGAGGHRRRVLDAYAQHPVATRA